MRSCYLTPPTAENGRSIVKRRDMTREELNRLGGIILDASIAIHRELGPGLLESAYELALAKELRLRNLPIRTQVPVELMYKGFL